MIKPFNCFNFSIVFNTSNNKEININEFVITSIKLPEVTYKRNLFGRIRPVYTNLIVQAVVVENKELLSKY